MQTWAQRRYGIIRFSSTTSAVGWTSAVIGFYFVFRNSSLEFLSSWATLSSLFAILIFAWVRSQKPPIESQKHEAFYLRTIEIYKWLKWAMSLCWLYPSLYVFPRVEADLQALVVIFVCALSTGGMTTNYFSKGLSVVSIVTYILPLGVAFLLAENSHGAVFAILFTILVIALVAQALKFYATLKTEFELMQSNESLAHENVQRSRSLARQEKLILMNQITGGIAHEVNNPLSIIIGFNENIQAELNKNPVDKEKLLHYTDRISVAVERAAHIIGRLRKISKSLPEQCFLPVRVENLFDGSLFCLHQASGLTDFEIHLPEALRDLRVSCQPLEICEALGYLLQNAGNAVAEVSDPRIWVEVEKREGRLQISVHDNGHGISAEDQARIFQPFFSKKPIGSGTGLGLPLAHAILESQGGSLRYEPHPTSTRFLIELPLVQNSDKTLAA